MVGDERVKTGIPGLDEIISGGFKRGSIITITGDSGCGKTTFAMQFIWAGITRYNEPGLYVSFEEERDYLFDNLKGYGWNLHELEKQKKLLFYEYPPQEVDRFVNQETLIKDAIDEHGVRRVAIDSVTSLALLYETEHRRREELVRLLGKLRRWNCTIVMTSESTTKAGQPRARFGVETLTDGLIYLYNLRKGNVRQRALEVIKLRGTNFEQRICPMRFTEKGIAIYPNEQVYETESFERLR
ncbi:MAG: ATPase domain-containing protein [Candidatus Micrarchaeia archaeon]